MAKAELNNHMITIVPGDVLVYNFHEANREFISSAIEYLPVGVGLPANTCIDAPWVNKKGYAICRNTNIATWEYTLDHRGETVYRKSNGEEVIISTLGDYPSDTTTTPPTTVYDKWDGEKWVTDIAAQKAGDISEAELKRQAFLSEANRVTADWRTELTLGIISSADKEKLIAWMEYIKAMKAIDTSTAPNVNWLNMPSI
jgi:hypothetical protein